MSAFKDYPQGRFYKGDCLEVMKEIPDGCIDMILCDLPYGTTACKWDTIIPLDLLWKQYERVSKESGAIVLTASSPFTIKLGFSNITNLKYTLVWNKVRAVGHLNAKKRPMQLHEDILVFCKNIPTYNPQDLKPCHKVNKRSTSGDNYNQAGLENISEFTNYPVSILEFGLKQQGKIHPTQKPVSLFEYLIKTYTNEGNLILDNCAGSGTTAIAAINTNRKFVLIEQDENYYNLANERIQKHIFEAK